MALWNEENDEFSSTKSWLNTNISSILIVWYVTDLWLVRNVEVISQVSSLISLYELISWVLPVKLVLGECHGTPIENSTLVQVKGCCLMAPCHSLIKSWPSFGPFHLSFKWYTFVELLLVNTNMVCGNFLYLLFRANSSRVKRQISI